MIEKGKKEKTRGEKAQEGVLFGFLTGFELLNEMKVQ